MLRTIIITLGGTFVSAAVFSSFPLMAVLTWRRVGPPLEQRDLIGGLIFWGLAAAVLAMVARATFRKERTAGERVWLARAASAAAVLGLGFGCWAGWSIRTGLAASMLSHADDRCRAHRLLGFADPGLCVTEARRCMTESWDVSDERRAPALRELLTKRRAEAERRATVESKQSGFYDDAEVRLIDALLRDLDAFTNSPNLSATERASLVCLAVSGGLAF